MVSLARISKQHRGHGEFSYKTSLLFICNYIPKSIFPCRVEILHPFLLDSMSNVYRQRMPLPWTNIYLYQKHLGFVSLLTSNKSASRLFNKSFSSNLQHYGTNPQCGFHQIICWKIDWPLPPQGFLQFWLLLPPRLCPKRPVRRKLCRLQDFWRLLSRFPLIPVITFLHDNKKPPHLCFRAAVHDRRRAALLRGRRRVQRRARWLQQARCADFIFHPLLSTALSVRYNSNSSIQVNTSTSICLPISYRCVETTPTASTRWVHSAASARMGSTAGKRTVDASILTS